MKLNLRKNGRFTEPGLRVFFFVLVFFAFVTYFFDVVLATAEAVIVVCLYIWYYYHNQRHRRKIIDHIESAMFNIESASKESPLSFPMPSIVLHVKSDEIVWANEEFYRITGEREHLFEIHLHDIMPTLDTSWLVDGHSVCPTPLAYKDRVYEIYGNITRMGSPKKSNLIATLYMFDITDFELLKEEYKNSRPCVSVITLDNYDEVTKNLSIDQKSSLVAKTDEKLSEYIMSSNGIIRKLERDRYLAVFEQRSLDEFIENKFSVLSAVREIENPDGMAVTLSFGIGKDASSFRENFDHALLALDMALSRGGDQAVIKNSTSFEYYGGHSKETEKRTKVKSRVTASALSQLMLTSSNVIVMGHAVSDMDSVGASIGICAIARFYGKTAYIATDINASSAYSLIRRMQATDEYANTFISRESAMLMADEDSLLVVVDTNRPEQTECPELLTKCSKIAVVDHHRRASSYIDNATVNFHESYASSASELVAELLQYTMEPSSLSKLESEALLAGITLDTKSFTSKTGVRTFEAAAFLRRCGSDTIEIKKLFQSDLSSELEKYGVMGNAKKLDEDIIIAVSEVEVSRVTASKVADEMLNISGVEASFVLFPLGDSFIISARSLGKINVQIILETLGGGGHLTMAGAQIQAPNVEDAKDMLVAAINTYKKSL